MGYLWSIKPGLQAAILKNTCITNIGQGRYNWPDLYEKMFCISYLFIICLASMLRVACGTARNLALSINLPVTRQMP